MPSASAVEVAFGHSVEPVTMSPFASRSALVVEIHHDLDHLRPAGSVVGGPRSWCLGDRIVALSGPDRPVFGSSRGSLTRYEW